jgi:hypothetical protein
MCAHGHPRAGPAFLAALAGLAACGDGGGGSWQLVARGQGAALMSVGGTSASDVYAVGADHGSGPAVVHYDGHAWKTLVTGQPGDLWWLQAFAGGPVFMGGANANVLRYDGSSFERMLTPGLPKCTVFGVWGASPTDVYAVGSVAGGNGFIWHFDGQAWTEVALPDSVPTFPNGDNPGLFKVWGSGASDVWVVGDLGVVLHKTTGDFELVASGTNQRLFTIAGSGAGGAVVAVGGGGLGVVLEEAGGSFSSAAIGDAPLLQGVALAPDGTGLATGQGGAVYARTSAGAWSAQTLPFAIDAESLHAVWLDPDGGAWAVGGNVLSTRLDDGTLVRRGPAVSPLPGDTPPDAGQAPVVCPPGDVDPRPVASIARRWDEQMLASIRRDLPRPTVHARNLYHVSAALYDAWAAYDPVARGVFFREKATAADPAAARTTAISYAAYRVLAHRYGPAVGGAVDLDCYAALMGHLGLDPADTHADGDDPIAVGNRAGAAVIAATADDGANEAANYADTTGFVAINPPLLIDEHGTTVTDPSVWQPLDLAVAVTQNGIPTPAGTQVYVGAQWGLVTPFAMSRQAPGALYHDPGAAPVFDSAIIPHVVEVIQRSSELEADPAVTLDISPGALGANPLGTNDGHGTPVNPATGAPYAPEVVPQGDFGRVVAEFWADGPHSETPPGHWNVIANGVADSPAQSRRLLGQGPVLDPLEWDVKVYVALNGAVHDAAITAWEIKRKFVTTRPITLVRYMGGLGQSSDPSAPHYDPMGLPLVPGLIELITAESAAPGQRHEALRRYVGQMAIRAWPGEPGDRTAQTSNVTWILAVDWVPYQRRTFVTPAFPGFISGHSTFSRAAAEVLTALTGSPYFPGGLGEYAIPAGTGLSFEQGPTVAVRLQWATYYDAADQAGQSRIWGGIHIQPDDFVGRRLGSAVGIAAVARALAYFDGTAP